MREYFVYITTNVNKTVLYIGVTSNLAKRLEEHQTAEGKSFTARYNIHYLLYYERHANITDALTREKVLKRWTRARKEELIETMNPYWKFLNEEEL